MRLSSFNFHHSVLLCCVAPLLAPMAQGDTTYTIEDTVELLDDTFYNRPSYSDAFFPSISNDGTRVAFYAFDRATQDFDLYLVDVGDPDSFEFLHSLDGVPESFSIDPFFWSADDSALIIDEYNIDLATATPEFIAVIEDLDVGSGPMDVPVDHISTSRLPSGNFGYGRLPVSEINLWPIGVERVVPSGIRIADPVGGFITNIPGFHTGFLSASPDKKSVAFTDNGVDIFVLGGVPEIFDGPITDGVFFDNGVTTLSDPKVAHIRPPAEGGGRWPMFSLDGTRVFFTVDFNGFFAGNGHLPVEERVQGSDFDIMVARADGTPIAGANDGATGDYRIAEAGTQVISSVSTLGNLVVIGEKTGALADPARIFVARFAVHNQVSGDDLSSQMVEVDIDGTPTMITLSDNSLQIPTGSGGETIEDAAGTTVELPEEQIVEFPDGSSETTITVKGPTEALTSAQLPMDASSDSLIVAKEFGPSGTNFYPPIQITYTYSDLDVAGKDENTLEVFVFNTGTMMFEAIPEEDIISRSPSENEIVFQVDHFSVYALGGMTLPVPAQTPAGLFILIAGVVLLFIAAAIKTVQGRSTLQRP